MQPIFLKPKDLANRWGIKITTLSQWRWSGHGPHYLKIGRHVSYLLQDIEEFELRKRHQNTSEYPRMNANYSQTSHASSFKDIHLLKKKG